MAKSEAHRINTEIEIETLRQVIEHANTRIKELTEKLKAIEVPPAPPANARLSVEVQFALNPNVYEFLIKCVPNKGYYTTGTLSSNSYFPTWAALWAYFNSEDVVRRTPFQIMSKAGFPHMAIGTEVDRRTEF